MLDIVIAHYTEDLEWVKSLNQENIKNIYIYSKRNKKDKKLSSKFTKTYFEELNPKVKYQHLDNIGRESETYLRFCYENYEKLSDGVIFLQGTPHVPIPEIVDWIENLTQVYDYTPNYIIDSIYYMLPDCKMLHWNGPCQTSKYNCFTFIRKYISHDLFTHGIKIYVAANFGVSKKHILSRSREYYINLIDEELKTVNPESGHFCERSWFYLFNCHKIKQKGLTIE